MATTGPRESTVRQLFALSMNRCAFPACDTPILDSVAGTILAEVCHIHAQSPGGPRFDPEQSDEERNGFANLVLMCSVHHKLIDAKENLASFTAQRLKDIKREHEDRAKGSAPAPELSATAASALVLSATEYQSGSVHMDFRHARFRVGGEGGSLGGGGGGGGMLTIVGLSRVPPDLRTDLSGGPGRAPGGGGGGGGAIRFEGRPAELDDEKNGLRVSSLFVANALSHSGLINGLGIGWDRCPLAQVPGQVNLRFGCVIEGGQLDPSTLLRIDLGIADPSGRQVTKQWLDVEISDRRVRRALSIQRIAFEVTEVGVWTASLSSGSLHLASYPIEFCVGDPVAV